MNLNIYNHFKVEKPYYNGYELLSKLDRNGNKPEIFISTSNRSAGKSTFFNGYSVSRFLKYGEKTTLLFRYKYEIEGNNAINSFFPAVQELFFPELEMFCEVGLKNVYSNIYIKAKNDEKVYLFGHAISLSARNQIKKYSNMLNDTARILFDEFQPEDKRYLKNEVEALESIHTSLSRGGGSQSKYLPLIMISNLVDFNNPYYSALDVINDMDINCNFYRGNGFVIEQGFNESSASAHKKSMFSRAFENSEYKKMTEQKTYLQTDYNGIIKINDLSGFYVCNLKHKNKYYCCRLLTDLGIYYISENYDKTFNLSFACTKSDIDNTAVFIQSNRIIDLMKKQFFKGNMKFSNFSCREAFLNLIGQKNYS